MVILAHLGHFEGSAQNPLTRLKYFPMVPLKHMTI